ncbi:hypothetical protein FOL47_002789, partial [Perkinsus chesapeaki]
MLSLFRRLSGLLHRNSTPAGETPGTCSESSSRKRRLEDDTDFTPNVTREARPHPPLHCVQTLRKRTLPTVSFSTPRPPFGNLSGDPNGGSRKSCPTIRVTEVAEVKKGGNGCDLIIPIATSEIDALEGKCRSFSRHPQVDEGLLDSIRKKELFLNDAASKEQVKLDCIDLDNLRIEYGSRQEVRGSRKLLIDWLVEAVFSRIDACHYQNDRRTKEASHSIITVPLPLDQITISPVDNVKRLRGVSPEGTPTTLNRGSRMSSATTTISSNGYLTTRPSYPTRVITTSVKYPKGRKRVRRSSNSVGRTPPVNRRLSDSSAAVPMSISPKIAATSRRRPTRNSVGGHEDAEYFGIEEDTLLGKKKRKLAGIEDLESKVKARIAELDAQGEAFWHLSCLKEASTLQTLRECRDALRQEDSEVTANRRALGAILMSIQHFLCRRLPTTDVDKLSSFLDDIQMTKTRDELAGHVDTAISLLITCDP